MEILGLIAAIVLHVLAIAWTVGLWLIGGAFAYIAVSTALVMVWAVIAGGDEVKP